MMVENHIQEDVVVEHLIELEDSLKGVSKDILYDLNQQSLEINESDCHANFNIDISENILENTTEESFELNNSDFCTSLNDSKYCILI